jgi:dienelactone hydrolase
MNAILKMCAGITASMIVFSSCQKNVISEPQSESISQQVSSEANAADAEPETTPPLWTSVVTNVNANVAGFWQGLPAKYSRTTKSYPLIVFIHGIGELGTSLSRMNCCGLPNHMYNKTFPAQFTVNGVNHSFLVIAPQFKQRPSAADVQSVINYARNRWRVDGTRIYVTGLSMGGGSTWDWSAVYGQNAAAIVPVCGGTKPTTTMAQNIASKNLPIWGLYSSADAVVPVQWGYDFFRWIDQYNTTYASKTKLTVWTDASHNSTWSRAFNPNTKVDGYNIYQWMLLYKRGTTTTAPAPTPTTGNQVPIARAGADASYPKSWNWFPVLNGNSSTDPDGWLTKYVWTKVSGPACTLSVLSSGRSKVTGWSAGTYVFRITVTDNKGATDYDDIKITITNN